jgi:hypothetical protein
MTGDVRQTTPPDEEISECWERLPADEIYLRGVEACTGEFFEGQWQVSWHAGEYFRDDPLGVELRQRFRSALGAVPGVTSVQDIRWETWEVGGTPSGEELCRAAAAVVDEFADRMRVAYESDDY